MKKQILILATVLILAGCDKEGKEFTPVVPGTKYQVNHENYTFYSDAGRYNDTNINRTDSETCYFDWDIEMVKRAGNVLTLEISRPASCKLEYELIWDGAIMESYPMRANIYINALSASCEDEDKQESDILVIDLEGAFKDLSSSTLRATNFYLREVCDQTDIQCMKDCEVSISN